MPGPVSTKASPTASRCSAVAAGHPEMEEALRDYHRVSERIAAGEDVIDLGMGNPDLGTPGHIVEEMVTHARDKQHHRYSASRGIYGLREGMADHYRGRYGVELDAEKEVVVTIGAKEGIAHLMLAILEPGDTVIVPAPAYPSHRYSVLFAGGRVHSVQLREGEELTLDGLREFLRNSLSGYKLPRALTIVAELSEEGSVAHHLEGIARIAIGAGDLAVEAAFTLSYEDLEPLIEQSRKGEQNVIWPTPIKWFAKSSGTTNAKSKFIPVSNEALEDCHYKGGKDLIALVALGFLQREDGVYSNTRDTDLFLDQHKPSYIGGILEMCNERLYGFWGSLTKALRTGQPAKRPCS